jgi:hypothetical protein
MPDPTHWSAAESNLVSVVMQSTVFVAAAAT